MDVFFILLFGHALGDFALQNDSMLTKKNPKNNPSDWYVFLGAHAVIHGGLVGFLSGSFTFALAETVCHFVIDLAKCKGKISLKLDQALHIACKALWVLLMYQGIA